MIPFSTCAWRYFTDLLFEMGFCALRLSSFEHQMSTSDSFTEVYQYASAL